MTVGDIIEAYDLQPFAPLIDDWTPDSHGEVLYPVGTTVKLWNKEYRVIGRRRVSEFALPHTDEFEVYIESQDDKSSYFVGESMIEDEE